VKKFRCGLRDAMRSAPSYHCAVLSTPDHRSKTGTSTGRSSLPQPESCDRSIPVPSTVSVRDFATDDESKTADMLFRLLLFDQFLWFPRGFDIKRNLMLQVRILHSSVSILGTFKLPLLYLKFEFIKSH